MVGLICGAVGPHALVRRISLLGDMISHAILPGVILGFLLSEERNLWVIFLTSSAVSLFAIWLLNLLNQVTKLKTDTSMGLILGGFFGIGVMLISYGDWSSKLAGVDNFLFGQMSNLSLTDTYSITIAAVLVLSLTWIFQRPLLVTSFDPSFAINLGYSSFLINLVFYSLVTLAIVISVQCIGVILVSSLLIIPATTAHLLTDSMKKLTLISIGIALVSSLIGVLGSWFFTSIPAGPLVTITASLIFILSTIFSPHHGWLKSFRAKRVQNSLIEGHHALKWLYKKKESPLFSELPKAFQKTLQELEKLEQIIQKEGQVLLTSKGKEAAEQLIRKHRLWETYLTEQLGYPSDHVHADADKIEHLLLDHEVEEIAKILAYPKHDPHGQPIPASSTPSLSPSTATGNSTSTQGQLS